LLTYLDVYLDDVNYVGVYYNSHGSGVMHGFSCGRKLKNLMQTTLCLRLVTGPSQNFGSQMEDKIMDVAAPLYGVLQFGRIADRRRDSARCARPFQEVFRRRFSVPAQLTSLSPTSVSAGAKNSFVVV
jgi:hypothetical protein